MLRALGHAGLVAEFLCKDGKLVVEEHLGVSQRGGFLAEQFVDLVCMLLDLRGELVGVVLRSQRVGVGQGDELHALGGCQCLESVNHLRYKLLEHLQHLTRDGERAVELAAAQADHLLQRLAEGQIRGGGEVLHLVLTLHILVIVVVGADIKEAVAFHPIGSVHLEAKAYIFHKAINLASYELLVSYAIKGCD